MNDLLRRGGGLALAVALSLALVVVLGGGCFESGPLGVGADVPGATGGGDPTGGGGEPTGGGETGGDETGRGGGDDDTAGGGGDTGDTGGGDETDDVPACETDPDCAPLDDGDLCTGVLRCLAQACVLDEGTIPVCPPLGDPCLDNVCEPSTGACVPEEGCQCEPLSTPLGCGKTTAVLSPFDPGLTGALFGYPCGGPGFGDGPEHVYLFTAPDNETVLVEVTQGDVAGLQVLDHAELGCDPLSCIGVGLEGVVFSAVKDRHYAVVVEHVTGQGSQIKLKVSCGVSAEFDCDNGIDDDGNGLTDCDEALCLGQADCPALKETECADGVDEDGDGLTDCEDPSCTLVPPCLQECQPSALEVYCGFHQVGTTGGGQAQATDYSCGGAAAPSSPGKEVVHPFQVDAVTNVTVLLSSGAADVAAYLLRDDGLGCTPVTCQSWTWANHPLGFVAQPGVEYFIAIDSPTTEAASYDFSVECQ